jgi:hypothetical protein
MRNPLHLRPYEAAHPFKEKTMERKQSDPSRSGIDKDRPEIEKKSPRPDLDVKGRPGEPSQAKPKREGSRQDERQPGAREGSGGSRTATPSERSEGMRSEPGREKAEQPFEEPEE